MKGGTFPRKNDYMLGEKRCRKNVVEIDRHGVGSQGNSLNKFENLNPEESRVIPMASDG